MKYDPDNMKPWEIDTMNEVETAHQEKMLKDELIKLDKDDTEEF